MESFGMPDPQEQGFLPLVLTAVGQEPGTVPGTQEGLSKDVLTK